jgi:hypothetical protein
MAKHQLNLIGAHPIAVGNRVEVTWYSAEEVTTSLFGAEKKSVKEIDTPAVHDLTTGIRYWFLGHFDDQQMYRAGVINVPRHSLRANLVVRGKIAGTVESCSIVDIRFENRGSDQVETELVIEVG